jgi:predicted nicotinamide N-methyase
MALKIFTGAKSFLKTDIKPFNITEIDASKKMNKADV